jgi:hypothetical protein
MTRQQHPAIAAMRALARAAGVPIVLHGDDEITLAIGPRARLTIEAGDNMLAVTYAALIDARSLEMDQPAALGQAIAAEIKDLAVSVARAVA